jgi:hypothetical protein
MEHAKPVVVLGRENDVPDTDQTCQLGPHARIERPWPEAAGKFVVVSRYEIVGGPNEWVADVRPQYDVDAPVNEKADTKITEPLEPISIVVYGVGVCHGI